MMTKFELITMIAGIGLALAAVWRWFLWSAFPDTSQLIIYLIASAGIVLSGMLYGMIINLRKEVDKLKYGLEDENGS